MQSFCEEAKALYACRVDVQFEGGCYKTPPLFGTAGRAHGSAPRPLLRCGQTSTAKDDGITCKHSTHQSEYNGLRPKS